MGDDTEKPQLVRVQSEWSREALKEHLESLIEALDKRVTSDIRHAKETASLAQTSSQRAIDKADEAITKRFEGFNEFNTRMNKVTSDSLTRETFVQFASQYAADKEALQKQLAADKLATETRSAGTVGAQASTDKSKETLRSNFVAIVLAVGVGATFLGGLVGAWLKGSPAAQQAQQPQVIYIPATPGTLIPSTPQQQTQR